MSYDKMSQGIYSEKLPCKSEMFITSWNPFNGTIRKHFLPIPQFWKTELLSTLLPFKDSLEEGDSAPFILSIHYLVLPNEGRITSMIGDC